MKGILTLFLLFLFFMAFAQDDAVKRNYNSIKVSGAPPKIDGLENEDAWEQVPWEGENFTQRQPDDGAQPSQQTKFKVLYDDKNVYVLVRALDDAPEKIVSRMSRRDGFDGDRIAVMFDSYFDKRTAFSFTASASGVKGDEYVSNNGDNWDRNWDPIWYLQTSIDDKGWIAEMKIPLSQLRFAKKDLMTWGLQVSRYVFRNDEWSVWQYIPMDAPGWVHLFGELSDLKGIKPQKQLEVQPYVVAQTETSQREEDNPFATGSSSDITFGVDAKVGITSDITLDVTINPDFGQVEADPSQVNLTAFQLFFPEQRPFFIEGNNILTFPLTNSSDNLFYSRRIGRRPQGGVNTDDDGEDEVAEFVNRPSNTAILGSMKLTGKNKKGFSWGVLESYTRDVFAEVDSLGTKRKELIEPATNYLVGRVQQDINAGETVIGGMVTATNRGELGRLNHLVQDAYSAGLDFTHFWNDRKYFIQGNVVGSNVSGTEESITRLQESPVRFFQREDNDHRDLDTTRNSLQGTGGSLMFGKRTGEIIYDIGGSWSSPGLELNDIGFMRNTDRIAQWGWLQYRKLQPFGPFRFMRWNVNLRQEWDFGGNRQLTRLNSNAHFQFKNFWNISSGGNVRFYEASNAELRGGPQIRYPRSYSYWIWGGTDRRKKVRFELNPWWSWSQDNFRRTRGWWTRLTLRPSDALDINITGSISRNINEMQYVTTTTQNNESKYLIGRIDQMIYNISFRATYVITPNLSIQYWGQPFASSGAYSNLKEVTNGSANSYADRFVLLGSSYNVETGDIDIDQNNDGEIDYSISNPDFNITQFQSNMVLRWEYIPGSTLFLVWTQSLNASPAPQDHSFDHLFDSFLDNQPTNIFLVKYTYRFRL